MTMKLGIFLATLDNAGWIMGEIVTESSIIEPSPLGWASIALIGAVVTVGIFFFKRRRNYE